MSKNPSSILYSALRKMFRPLVRILLRNGVSYAACADILKWVYVDVAKKESGKLGKEATLSRVAVLTGLTRKEACRVSQLPKPEEGSEGERYNRAARVIGGWVRDFHFADAQGQPAELPIEGQGASFANLVKTYSGDIGPAVILDELVKVGAVSCDSAKRRVKLLVRAYVPGGSEMEKLVILGADVSELISTIEHNLTSTEPRFQRTVFYDNLPAEALPRLRLLAGEWSQDLIAKADQWMAHNDRDANPAVTGTGKKYASIGIYYFEKDHGDET
jgi:hypothetical protein